MEKAGFIPEEVYKTILDLVPLPCVDLVVVYDDKFLLGKRVNKPNQGEWFVFGGRVLKNETLVDAARRKLKDELGINAQADELQLLTTGETIQSDSNIDGVTSHTINTVFLYKTDKKPEIHVKESENSEIQWYSKIDKDWQPYVRLALEAAGFEY